jgi:hypothetical protein
VESQKRAIARPIPIEAIKSWIRQETKEFLRLIKKRALRDGEISRQQSHRIVCRERVGPVALLASVILPSRNWINPNSGRKSSLRVAESPVEESMFQL